MRLGTGAFQDDTHYADRVAYPACLHQAFLESLPRGILVAGQSPDLQTELESSDRLTQLMQDRGQFKPKRFLLG